MKALIWGCGLVLSLVIYVNAKTALDLNMVLKDVDLQHTSDLKKRLPEIRKVDTCEIELNC